MVTSVKSQPIARSNPHSYRSVGKPLVTRGYFQLGGGFLLAIVLPTLIRYQFSDGFFNLDIAVYTMIASTLAMSTGYFISRRLSKFPGDTERPYILLIYSMMFGLAMGVIFMLRLDYSRFLFFTSFAVCIIWFSAVHLTVRRMVMIKLAIVRGGNIDKLLKIKRVRWKVLESTDMYKPEYGAIVADLRSDLSSDWIRFIADSTLHGIPVFHSKQALEMLTGKVDIEHLSENSFGSLLPELTYLRFRRAADIVATVLLLPLILFILAGVSIAILATSGGPVFFKQKRIGYRGVIFTAYKFRTMVEEEIDYHPVEKSSSTLKMRNQAMTDEDDLRITPIGRILRKYRIDELPQVLNILKGEMGWIGPRPEALALSKWYEEELPFYSYRHIVRPGITGWAQVNQGHVTQASQVLEKLHYDFFYIKNLSAWLDILIVLRTIRVVFLGIGSK